MECREDASSLCFFSLCSGCCASPVVVLSIGFHWLSSPGRLSKKHIPFGILMLRTHGFPIPPPPSAFDDLPTSNFWAALPDGVSKSILNLGNNRPPATMTPCLQGAIDFRSAGTYQDSHRILSTFRRHKGLAPATITRSLYTGICTAPFASPQVPLD